MARSRFPTTEGSQPCVIQLIRRESNSGRRQGCCCCGGCRPILRNKKRIRDVQYSSIESLCIRNLCAGRKYFVKDAPAGITMTSGGGNDGAKNRKQQRQPQQVGHSRCTGKVTGAGRRRRGHESKPNQGDTPRRQGRPFGGMEDTLTRRSARNHAHSRAHAQTNMEAQVHATEDGLYNYEEDAEGIEVTLPITNSPVNAPGGDRSKTSRNARGIGGKRVGKKAKAEVRLQLGPEPFVRSALHSLHGHPALSFSRSRSMPHGKHHKHRVPLRTNPFPSDGRSNADLSSEVYDGDDSVGVDDAPGDILENLPATDELTALRKELHQTGLELSSLQKDRLELEVALLRKTKYHAHGKNGKHKRHQRRWGYSTRSSETERGEVGVSILNLLEQDEWDVDVMLDSSKVVRLATPPAVTGLRNGSRRGKLNENDANDEAVASDDNLMGFGNSDGKDDEDDDEVGLIVDRLSSGHKSVLQHGRGLCLTAYFTDDVVRNSFICDFADDVTNADNDDDSCGDESTSSTLVISSMGEAIDEISAMAISHGEHKRQQQSAAPHKRRTLTTGKQFSSLSSTASNLITICGCRSLRNMALVGLNSIKLDSGTCVPGLAKETQTNVGFWHSMDDGSSSFRGILPPAFERRLKRESHSRNGGVSGSGAFGLNNISYLSTGALGSYFVQFASGECWWGLGGKSRENKDAFGTAVSDCDVRRVAFGSPLSNVEQDQGSGELITSLLVPWIVLGNDGRSCWSAAGIQARLQRKLLDRPPHLAAPIEVSLGGGGSYFIKYADGTTDYLVSASLARVLDQIERCGGAVTNLILHSDSYDYIVRHT